MGMPVTRAGAALQSLICKQELSRVLVVDDEEIIRESLAEWLESEGFACETARTGREALEKLHENSFALVLTDIRMPEASGLELLERANRECPDVAVIMVTSADDLPTAVHTMQLGACDYITKPFRLEEIRDRIDKALKRRLVRQHAAEHLERLKKELCEAHDATIRTLSWAVELRDRETADHMGRVAEITVRLARAMSIGEPELIQIRRGALLHDIGKIGIPDSILLKSGPLTAEEWEVMRQHPVTAYELLSEIDYLRPALDIPYCHHEKWDGSGYPRGLRGGEIPLAARIFAVVDVWDALSSHRPYSDPWPVDSIRSHILAQVGRHFDAQVIEVFLKTS